MPNTGATIQRSFRLTRRTSELLDDATQISGESRNAIADRLLGEALRTERHPLVRFIAGAAGRREPHLVGTRLRVRHVITSLREHDGDAAATADHLEIPLRLVNAAIDYAAAFGDEVEADIAWAERTADDERRTWERGRGATT